MAKKPTLASLTRSNKPMTDKEIGKVKEWLEQDLDINDIGFEAWCLIDRLVKTIEAKEAAHEKAVLDAIRETERVKDEGYERLRVRQLGEYY